MADLKDQPMDDGDIIKVLELTSNHCGYYDSELSQERVTSITTLSHPSQLMTVTRSSYHRMSTLIQSMIHMKHSQLANAMSNSRHGLKTCKRLKYARPHRRVMWRQNDCFSVFQSVILDGLMARVGVCKVFWEESTEAQEEEFVNLTSDELDVILSADDVELVDSTTNDLGLISGTIERSIDTSQVRIQSVSPEEFIIEPQATDLDNIDFCAHRTDTAFWNLLQDMTKTRSQRSADHDEELGGPRYSQVREDWR